VDSVNAEQYAIEYREGDGWLQYVASSDKTEILRLWRHLQHMDVRKPIRLTGFDVLHDSAVDAPATAPP
jgi:hypothetical protein